jgi:predicted  nucleic acid-binding Zn-ribbon protein
MKSQIKLLAGVAYIDRKLDDLKEEFGDLPEEIATKQEELSKAKALVDETDGILNDIKDFVKEAKVNLVKLKDREQELAKKQFDVKNNKEFDAITNEIKHIKEEHEELSIKMRKEGLKQENLESILLDQREKLNIVEREMEEMLQEEKDLASEQSDEKDFLASKRDKIESQISGDILSEYNRIRANHPDAAVPIVKGSCLGYKIPPQKLVEIRNNMDRLYLDENSGRILIPEEIYVDEDVIEELAS